MKRALYILPLFLLFLAVLPSVAGAQGEQCAMMTCDALTALIDVPLEEAKEDYVTEWQQGLEEADVQRSPWGNYYLLGFERDQRDHRLVYHERMTAHEERTLQKAYWARAMKDGEQMEIYLTSVACIAELECRAAVDALEMQYYGNRLVPVAAAVAKMDFARGIVLLRDALVDDSRRPEAMAVLAEITGGEVKAGEAP
jgi:hypothetical protein